MDKTTVVPQASEKGVMLPPLSVNPVISPIRNCKKAKGPTSSSQEINISAQEEMHSQPAALLPEIIHPDARTQAPPPYPEGKGVSPPPLLPPEGGEEEKGGGGGMPGNLIRKNEEEEVQKQVHQKTNKFGNQQKSFNSGKNTQSRFTTKKMMFSLLIACGAVAGLMLRPVSGYSLEYYDCRHPTKVNKFARPTVCDPFAAEEEVTTGTTYKVLTQAAVREVPGWSCEVIVSEWRYRFGVFSHMKLSGVPHLLRHSTMTTGDCRGMVRSKHYTPKGRTVGMSLKLNTWNYFQLTASGNLEAYTSYLTCKGQETRHREELVENEVTLLELRVRVKNEMFLIHKG
ncbi:MAG: hypothetical protein GY696_23855, partial [Gammaproteobacteria bacterium]|nr:hypothetical protein [Gammaproteobacteria bacterium]